MTETDRSPVFTGGCQCGAIRYALFTRPKNSICHCRMCQRAVGGPFAALAMVPATDLAWTRGLPAIFRSSSLAKRGFCPVCGTPLTYQGIDADNIEVTIASLDTPNAAAPTEQFGSESQLAWFATLPTLPASPTDCKFAGVVSYQSPEGAD